MYDDFVLLFAVDLIRRIKLNNTQL